MEMIWEEPPPQRHSSMQAMLEQLQANPGRWALVNTQRGAGGGTATLWKKKGCEATTRSRDGVVKTYARWPETGAATAAVAEPTPRAAKASSAPTRPKGITPADVEAMAELRAQGWSLTTIGEKFGISRVMAGKHVRRYQEAIEQDPEARTDTTPAPEPDTTDNDEAPTLGSIRRATLVAQHTKGTCRTCGARNRGLTDGECRMCIIRAREKAALTEDGAA